MGVVALAGVGVAGMWVVGMVRKGWWECWGQGWWVQRGHKCDGRGGEGAVRMLGTRVGEERTRDDCVGDMGDSHGMGQK